MAMLKVLNGKGKYHDLKAREDVSRYIFNPLKAESGLMGGIGVTSDIVGSMDEIAAKYNKTNGVQLRHFVISFPPDELDSPEEVYKIASRIAQFIAQEFQVIFAVHENTENLHIHFMFNLISHRDGHRYQGKKKEYYDLVNFIKSDLKYFYGINLLTVSNCSEINIQ